MCDGHCFIFQSQRPLPVTQACHKHVLSCPLVLAETTCKLRRPTLPCTYRWHGAWYVWLWVGLVSHCAQLLWSVTHSRVMMRPSCPMCILTVWRPTISPPYLYGCLRASSDLLLSWFPFKQTKAWFSCLYLSVCSRSERIPVLFCLTTDIMTFPSIFLSVGKHRLLFLPFYAAVLSTVKCIPITENCT